MTVGHVIVGNCIAAIGAIEGIRRHDRVTPITVLSKEPYPAYGRPLIANYLKGKLSDEEIALRSPDFYERKKVNLFLGRPATRIRLSKRVVEIEGVEELGFDRLLIATGGNPIVPSLPGLEGAGVFFFNTLDNAKELSRAAGRLKNVLVIGGGLIGLKAAESLHDLGIRVTIVELADRILSMAFDRVAARIIALRLEEIGIRILTNNTVEEILRRADGELCGVRLRDGTELACDAVIVAIGVTPNKELVEATDVQTRRGILVDEFMETNIPGIYAAGDVAEARDWYFTEWRVVPIWPNAYRQGQIAGRNMAKQRISFTGSIPMNSIAFYGIPTISVGVTNPPDNDGYEILEKLDEGARTYRKLVFKGGVLMGCVLVGRVGRAGILTGLIREKRPVGAFREVLLRDDLAYLDLPRALRKEKLGLPTEEVPFGVRYEPSGSQREKDT